MAYHLWDGFDNYNGSNELWPSIGPTVAYSSAYARFTAPSGLLGQGMKITGSGSKAWNMSSNQATMIFGFPLQVEQLGSGPIMFFLDGSTVQCSLWLQSNGAIELVLSYGGAVIAATGPGLFTPGVWHWLDIEITINNASGAIAVYLDSPAGAAAILNDTGLNTRSTANNYMNAFRIGDMNAVFVASYWDDFHAHDISGSAPNAILGDSRIYTKKASGAGYATNWTPNGASANWQCIDDSPPDGDTTYNSSNTPGTIDGYTVPTAGFTVAPNGVVRRSYVRRDDAGPHTFQNGIRSGSTNGLGTAFSVPSSYAWTDCGTCYVNDPATGSPWANASAADAASMVIDETS